MGYHTHLYHNEHKLSLSHAVATWANTTPLNKRQNNGIHYEYFQLKSNQKCCKTEQLKGPDMILLTVCPERQREREREKQAPKEPVLHLFPENFVYVVTYAPLSRVIRQYIIITYIDP